MKKVFLFFNCVLMLLGLSQCSKPTQHSRGAYVYNISNDEKTANSLISFYVGHSSVVCKGTVVSLKSFITFASNK